MSVGASKSCDMRVPSAAKQVWGVCMLACPGSPLPLHPSFRTPGLWLWLGESRARAGQGLLGARSSLGVCVERVGALWDCGGGWEVGGDRWGFIQSPPRQSQAGCVVGSLLSLQCSVTSVTASYAPSYPLVGLCSRHWGAERQPALQLLGELRSPNTHGCAPGRAHCPSPACSVPEARPSPHLELPATMPALPSASVAQFWAPPAMPVSWWMCVQDAASTWPHSEARAACDTGSAAPLRLQNLVPQRQFLFSPPGYPYCGCP